MKSNIDLLEPGSYYHIFNRGINKESVFKERKNYAYFLEKCMKYIHPIAKTFSYCLLSNHFHFLIQIRTEDEIRNNLPLKDGIEIKKLISHQFSHLFNSYAQSINKSTGRTGGLFETPFRRIAVQDENHLNQLVLYIHFNPVKHGFTNDYINYPFSSYQLFLNDKETRIARDEVISWFGDLESFIKSHQEYKNYNFSDVHFLED
ncbi:MAG: hypothetical protein KKE39_00005 [Bacteroidetes bacterium]|nr:hypothetical protein [Bacteroidota bacterium]MBU1371549.1 hypothetical protein [Bacteroidota bacterium]MBU1486131.1 hypothetical protein [Bacteroidota bacterium]MBU1759770.1 hypothetical protein [Bacteroidota bacterium]MBU2046946.1 hypothetical protein [Bacteroidota bacterium]